MNALDEGNLVTGANGTNIGNTVVNGVINHVFCISV